jgi:prolyl oligopeptidase
MKIPIPLLMIFIIPSCLLAQKKYKYPEVKRDSFSQQFFDQIIEDPFQWLESQTDPEVEAFKLKQIEFGKKQMNKLIKVPDFKRAYAFIANRLQSKETIKSVLKKRTGKINKYEFEYDYNSYKISPDIRYKKKGDLIYKSLVKIKHLNKDLNAAITVENIIVNEEEDLAVVEFSENGSDWIFARIFDLKTGEPYPETLDYLWTTSYIWQGRALYYQRFDPPGAADKLIAYKSGQRICRHILGDTQDKDKVVYENVNANSGKYFEIIGMDGRYFLIHEQYSNGNQYSVLSAISCNENSFFPKSILVLPATMGISISPEVLIGDQLIVKTTFGAKNGRVLSVDLNNPKDIKELVNEIEFYLISVDRLGKDKLVCNYFKDGVSLGVILTNSGEILKYLNFPVGTSLNGLYEYDTTASTTLFSTSSFIVPKVTYELDLNTLEYEPIVKLNLPYQPGRYETRYVTYNSADGTEVSMYVTCAKDLKLNGKNPTLIEAYGGYGLTMTPSFEIENVLWTLNGVYVVPQVRGGGAKGEEWAKAGRGLNKQNCIDDFIAAADYLVENGYTSPEYLVSNGQSHGGMLVTAAMLQRPKLFSGVVAEVAVLDILRFRNFTIGNTDINISEFGDIYDRAHFENILSYSPYNNIKKGERYPDLCLMVKESDDRVPPFNSYKFLAKLQDEASKESLSFMYLQRGAGHGEGANVFAEFDYMAYKYAFLMKRAGIKFSWDRY